nr:unnamed protein product [Digitaria exilis]
MGSGGDSVASEASLKPPPNKLSSERPSQCGNGESPLLKTPSSAAHGNDDPVREIRRRLPRESTLLHATRSSLRRRAGGGCCSSPAKTRGAAVWWCAQW